MQTDNDTNTRSCNDDDCDDDDCEEYAIPITDLQSVYANVGNYIGRPLTPEDMSHPSTAIGAVWSAANTARDTQGTPAWTWRFQWGHPSMLWPTVPVLFTRASSGGYGIHLAINHGGGVVTLYAHNSRLLAGEGIHPYAKLVTVADVFDALISPRAYKQPWDQTAVCAYMTDRAGYGWQTAGTGGRCDAPHPTGTAFNC